MTSMLDALSVIADCIEVMRTLPDASVDAVVTDPPWTVIGIALLMVSLFALLLINGVFDPILDWEARSVGIPRVLHVVADIQQRFNLDSGDFQIPYILADVRFWNRERSEVEMYFYMSVTFVDGSSTWTTPESDCALPIPLTIGGAARDNAGAYPRQVYMEPVSGRPQHLNNDLHLARRERKRGHLEFIAHRAFKRGGGIEDTPVLFLEVVCRDVITGKSVVIARWSNPDTSLGQR